MLRELEITERPQTQRSIHCGAAKFKKRSGHRSIELIRENVNADVAVLNVRSGATLSATNGSAVFLLTTKL